MILEGKFKSKPFTNFNELGRLPTPLTVDSTVWEWCAF